MCNATAGGARAAATEPYIDAARTVQPTNPTHWLT
jgi:hypothetical protein